MHVEELLKDAHAHRRMATAVNHGRGSERIAEVPRNWRAGRPDGLCFRKTGGSCRDHPGESPQRHGIKLAQTCPSLGIPSAGAMLARRNAPPRSTSLRSPSRSCHREIDHDETNTHTTATNSGRCRRGICAGGVIGRGRTRAIGSASSCNQAAFQGCGTRIYHFWARSTCIQSVFSAARCAF
jgi:hypothetical protein